MENYWCIGEMHHVGASLIVLISPAGTREGRPNRLLSIEEVSNSWLGKRDGESYLFEIDGELFPSQIMDDGRIGIEVAIA